MLCLIGEQFLPYLNICLYWYRRLVRATFLNNKDSQIFFTELIQHKKTPFLNGKSVSYGTSGCAVLLFSLGCSISFEQLILNLGRHFFVTCELHFEHGTALCHRA